MTFSKFFILYHLAALNGATIENLDDRIVINDNQLEDIVVSEDGKTGYFKFHGGDIVCCRIYYHTENNAVALFDNRKMVICDSKMTVMKKYNEFVESNRFIVPKSVFAYDVNPN
jgi:hypothetical protein